MVTMQQILIEFLHNQDSLDPHAGLGAILYPGPNFTPATLDTEVQLLAAHANRHLSPTCRNGELHNPGHFIVKWSLGDWAPVQDVPSAYNGDELLGLMADRGAGDHLIVFCKHAVGPTQVQGIPGGGTGDDNNPGRRSDRSEHDNPTGREVGDGASVNVCRNWEACSTVRVIRKEKKS